MAIFRKIHVSFWKDLFVKKLTPEQKYFYLYLMTNSNTTQCGIYEIDFGMISYETGYNTETIQKLILFFESKGKIKYSTSTEEIAIKNWNKYNDSTSPKVKACVSKELKTVKNRVLIQYLYSIDTQTQEEQEQEQEEEQEQDLAFMKFYSSINVFLKNIFEEKKVSDITEINFFEMVVVEMNKVWMKHNPKYTFLKEVDYPALLRIAYLIANKNNISKYETVNVKDNEIVKLFEPFAAFYSTTNVAFYKKLTLDGIANPKNFQSISQNMSQVQLSEEEEITKSMTIDEKERYIRRKNFKPIEQP